MNAWLSLTKKELRLGVPAFLIPVIGFILVAAVAGYFGNRSGYLWEAVAGVAAVATGIQVFYLVYFLLISLQSEKKKLHLWLHNPMPAYALLLAKVVAGLFSMICTLAITITVLFVSIQQSSALPKVIPWEQIEQYWWVPAVHMLLFALDIAIWFIFYWMIYLFLSRYIPTFLSFASTFIFVVATSTFLGWLQGTAFYGTFTHWGEIKVSKVMESFHTEVRAGNAELSAQMGDMSFYVGSYVFEIIFALLIFFLASWILERKVEV